MRRLGATERIPAKILYRKVCRNVQQHRFRKQRLEILDLFINRDWTTREIAAEYGKHPGTIENLIRRCGFSTFRLPTESEEEVVLREAMALRQEFPSLDDYVSFLRLQTDLVRGRKRVL